MLAVKQDEQGSKFAFKYEGVEGKPFKLLEQLFMELVCGSGGDYIIHLLTLLLNLSVGLMT